MALPAQLKPGISRQISTGSLRNGKFSFKRQNSLDPRSSNPRFSFGRQSSLDPIRRSPAEDDLTVPENLDSTMQLLFLACRGDVEGVQELLDEGVDVNSIDLDGRTALHIAACEGGHGDVVKLLLSRWADIDARDRWGSTLPDALIACATSARKLAGTTSTNPLGEEKTFLPFHGAANAGVGGTAGIGGNVGLGGVGGAFGGSATGGLGMGSSFGGGDGTDGSLGGTAGLGGFGLGGQIGGGFGGGFGDRLP